MRAPESLADDVVDRLFSALLVRYGAPFLDRWRDLELAVVKGDWAHELAGFGANLGAIRFALDHLPERPPNVIEFRKLCNAASDPEHQQRIGHDAPVRGPTRAEREAMRRLSWTFGEPSRANRNWAHDLIAKHESDPQSVRSEPLRMARRAIGAVRPPDPDETPLSDAEALIAEYEGPWFPQEHEARQ